VRCAASAPGSPSIWAAAFSSGLVMLVVFGAKSLRSLDSLQLPIYNFSGVITDVETAMAFENVPF
jgi:hypothetical protein